MLIKVWAIMAPSRDLLVVKLALALSDIQHPVSVELAEKLVALTGMEVTHDTGNP